MKLVITFLMASAVVSFAEIKLDKLVESAKSQIGVTMSYDPAYRKLDYPGGDVPQNTGVCSDVLIRALRDQKIDLQKEVHEDMRKDFDAYPRKWGLNKPDRNIDHRRVPNLMTYFRRKGYQLSISEKPRHYLAGDIVAWDLGGGVTHIGIISDRRTTAEVPLVVASSHHFLFLQRCTHRSNHHLRLRRGWWWLRSVKLKWNCISPVRLLF